MVIGRVVCSGLPLRSIVKGSACVFFKTQINTRGTKERHASKHVHTELRACNFYLVDSDGQYVYIPAEQNPCNFQLTSMDLPNEIASPAMTPQLEHMCRGLVGNAIQNVSQLAWVYREGSFDVGQQVAIVGQITKMEVDGRPTVALLPVDSSSLEFKGWNFREKEAWKDVTKSDSKCLIGTNDVGWGMQNVTLPPLPADIDRKLNIGGEFFSSADSITEEQKGKMGFYDVALKTSVPAIQYMDEPEED